jgi:hypothetical protein
MCHSKCLEVDGTWIVVLAPAGFLYMALRSVQQSVKVSQLPVQAVSFNIWLLGPLLEWDQSLKAGTYCHNTGWLCVYYITGFLYCIRTRS